MVKKSLRIRVFGRLQGVHFRGTIRNYARALGMTGYVKNLPDGSVEISSEGQKTKLDDFLRKVEIGSLLSKVEGIDCYWDKYSGVFKDFVILRNGDPISDKLFSVASLGRKVLLSAGEIPRHVAIIPDGNRRWAKERGLSPSEGHRQGANRVKELLNTAQELGIKAITIWAFSTENWERDRKEVAYIFTLFRKVLKDFSKEAEKNHVRFRHFGRGDRMPTDLLRSIGRLEASTARFSQHFFNIAIDYGGRDEILRGVKKIIKGGIKENELNDETFSRFLDTSGIPDPDLIIRTSGERRLSGLFPWQGVYSELYFSPLHFPDFGSRALRLAVADYSRRQRRFGR